MAHPMRESSNRYLTDIVNLSVTLDEAISRDDSERAGQALSKGKERYFDLAYRRLSVDFRVGDGPIVLWLLDLIQAELATLARLQHERSLPPLVRNGAQPAASALDG